MIRGGISWALGRVDADVTPNLDQAAPGANTLPVRPEPTPEPAKK